MTIVEILRDAREHMSDPGRCAGKSQFDDGGEAVCLMAAFTRRNGARFSFDGRLSAYRIVERAVGEHLGERPHQGIGMSFYDRPETTHADVMNVLDRAVSIAEADQLEEAA